VDDATPNGTDRGWAKPGVTTGPRNAGAIPTRNPIRCAIRFPTLRTATKAENRARIQTLGYSYDTCQSGVYSTVEGMRIGNVRGKFRRYGLAGKDHHF